MSALTRDQILAVKDLKTERVAVPEWGGEVLIAALTGEQRDAWEQSILGDGKAPNIKQIRERLIMHCAVDEQGNRLFKPEDVAMLSKKSGVALERCAKVAQRINFLTDKDLDDAVKTLSSAQSDSSTTS